MRTSAAPAACACTAAPQTVQYILPQHHAKLAQAELLVIDEAAAIPLTTVKQLLGPYLVFLCSTVNGYEGTGARTRPLRHVCVGGGSREHCDGGRQRHSGPAQGQAAEGDVLAALAPALYSLRYILPGMRYITPPLRMGHSLMPRAPLPCRALCAAQGAACR
jgi:hypothetical protein